MTSFQKLPIAAYEESLQSVDLNQRLIAKLESMKTSPIISLQDSFLGDEGCRVLVEFFRNNSHSHITKLDLKGNNIGERGVNYLTQLLQDNDSIKKLTLEWNNIGVSDSAVNNICSALHHNTSLQELDLRNNQIKSSAAVYIAELIRSNRTLKRIDLRWNDLGRQGAQHILQAVQDNTSIHYIELVGNKDAEEVIQVMNTYLQRNRGEMVGGLSKMIAGVQSTGEDEIPYAVLKKESEYAEQLKAKYEAQVIAHSRTEKKTKELEKQLEHERRKLKTTNTELVKSLEEEKIARKLIETTLSKLKEDFAKQELEKDKLLQEISIKYDKIKVERAQYELELNKTRDAQLRNEQMYLDKINTLEDQMARQQSLYLELDETAKVTINKLRSETGDAVNEIHKKYEFSIRQKDENLRASLNEIELLKAQVSKLKTELLERKADEEIRLSEKIKEVNQIQRQFNDFAVQEQESKARMAQAQQEKLIKLQEQFKTDLDKLNSSHQKDLEQMENRINRLRDEKANESRETLKAQQSKVELEQTVKGLNTEIDKLKHEKSEIQSQIKIHQDRELSIRENVKKELQSQISSLSEQNTQLQRQNNDQEKAMKELRNENNRLNLKIQELGDRMKQNFDRQIELVLQDAFNNQQIGGNSQAQSKLGAGRQSYK